MDVQAIATAATARMHNNAGRYLIDSKSTMLDIELIIDHSHNVKDEGEGSYPSITLVY